MVSDAFLAFLGAIAAFVWLSERSGIDCRSWVGESVFAARRQNSSVEGTLGAHISLAHLGIEIQRDEPQKNAPPTFLAHRCAVGKFLETRIY